MTFDLKVTNFGEFKTQKSLVNVQHPTDHGIKGEILLELGTVHIVIILSDEVVVIPGDKM